MDKNYWSHMHFASHLTTLPLHPIRNTSTIFLILIEKDVTILIFQFCILYFAGFNNPTQLLRKQIGLQGNEETKLMYAKPAPMILGMDVALQLRFVRKCDLRQPTLWLNIPVRWCSAVAVST
jgi:hypothetical protein